MLFKCVYCGTEKPSENGTGSDVSCCGERGHVEYSDPILQLQSEWEKSIDPKIQNMSWSQFVRSRLMQPCRK